MFKIEKFFNPYRETLATYLTGHAVTGDPAEFSVVKEENSNGMFDYQVSGSLTFWDKKEKSFKTYPFWSLNRPAGWCAFNLTHHVSMIFVVDSTVHTGDDGTIRLGLWVEEPIVISRHYLDPAGPSFEEIYAEMLKGLKTVKAPKYNRTLLTSFYN